MSMRQTKTAGGLLAEPPPIDPFPAPGWGGGGGGGGPEALELVAQGADQRRHGLGADFGSNPRRHMV